MANDTTLDHAEIVVILRRHRGSLREIASGLGIRQSGVSQWLAGRSTSRRISAAAERTARKLLEVEKQQQQQQQAAQSAQQ